MLSGYVFVLFRVSLDRFHCISLICTFISSLVNGGWTAWARQEGTCRSNCQRTVSLTRTCTNPAPSGNGQPCSGPTTDSIIETCTGGFCVGGNLLWLSLEKTT